MLMEARKTRRLGHVLTFLERYCAEGDDFLVKLSQAMKHGWPTLHLNKNNNPWYGSIPIIAQQSEVSVDNFGPENHVYRVLGQQRDVAC